MPNTANELNKARTDKKDEFYNILYHIASIVL